MVLSFNWGSLVGLLLIEKTLKSGAICKDDQSRICRTLAEGGFSSSSNYHPNAGTCLAKRYSAFTHVCSVRDYSPSVAFCCCSTQTTHATTSSSSSSSSSSTTAGSAERILCCRYFQSWNTFRCDEEKDAVTPANSTLISVRVWTISLILFAVISLLTLLLIGCLRKAMANKKKNSSDQKSDPAKRWHRRSSVARDVSFHDHYLPPGIFDSKVAPLIPSAPSIDDAESYKEFYHYSIRRSPHGSNNSSSNNHSDYNDGSGAGDSRHKRPAESTSDSNNFDFCQDDDQSSSVFKARRGSVDANYNMLRDSVCVEHNIEINNEPPPPYDEVVGYH